MNPIGPQRIQPTVVGPASAAHTTPVHKSVDASQIEFKMMIEVKAPCAEMARALRDLPGWSASPSPFDCSHGRLGDDGYGSYTRIASPTLRLGSGALSQIEKALTAVKAKGAVPGPTGAMRLYVKKDLLNDAATTQLARMHKHNEDVLYRLGQNGGKGRVMRHKLHYAPRMPMGNHTSAQAWSHALGRAYYGMNAAAGNEWEFRYFDSSLDVKAVSATVQLFCGMAGAAIEGRGTFDGRHRASSFKRSVNRARWDGLMHDTVHPDVRRTLEANYRASGCSVPRHSFDATHDAISELVRRQYAFEDADGARYKSIGDIELAVEQRLVNGDKAPAFTVTDPVGTRVHLSAEQLSPYVCAANLRHHGVALYHVTEKGVAQLSLDTDLSTPIARGELQAHLPRHTWWNCFPTRRITIRSANALQRLSSRFTDTPVSATESTHINSVGFASANAAQPNVTKGVAR